MELALGAINVDAKLGVGAATAGSAELLDAVRPCRASIVGRAKWGSHAGLVREEKWMFSIS